MQIKKSAVISLLLAIGSGTLLVFTADRNKQSSNQLRPVPVKCSRQCNSTKLPVQWNMVPGNIFQPEG